MIKSVVTITFLFWISASYAQYQDVATWISAGFNFDIGKDISCELSEEIRYDVTVSDLYQVNTDFAVSYKFTKKIKAGVDYRYSVRSEKDVNRLGLSVTLREGFNDIDVSLRSRIQYAVVPDSREGSTWRNKGTIKYEKYKDLTPYLSVELFYAFSNELDQFDNYRLEPGLQWELTKHHELTLYYMYDKEFHVNEPLTLHIFGLGYVYKL